MSGVQRLIANHQNVLTGATLAASSVHPATNTVLPAGVSRQGSALLALVGDYTGETDARYEVEVLDLDPTDAPRISRPVAVGQGNGELSELSAVGLPAQRFTVTVASLGTALLTAGIDIRGIQVRARVPGADGNNLRFSVDRSGLTFTDSAYSLLRDIREGTQTLSGPEYDWDTVVASGEEIPSTARRLVFGADTSTVYIQWKTYNPDTGDWEYRLFPVPSRSIPAGTRIRFVTGGNTVTLTDGVTPEVYPGIVSTYDLLYALQQQSALVAIEGVLSPRRVVGGIALGDLRIRTDAYAATVDSGFVDVVVGPNAPTELIQARCWANSSAEHPMARLGHELWELQGSVSGVLAEALPSGQTYTHPDGRISLRIPRKFPDGYAQREDRGSIYLKEWRPASREGDTQPPEIKLRWPRLGINARTQTLTLRLVRKPEPICTADSAVIEGRPSAECLGLDDIEEETDVSLDPEYQSRLATLYAWYETAMVGQTGIQAGTLRAAVRDMDLMDILVNAWHDTLMKVATNAAGRLAWDNALSAMQTAVSSLLGVTSHSLDTWSPREDYNAGQQVVPPVPNGHYYQAITGGRSGEAPPAWPVNGGAVYEPHPEDFERTFTTMPDPNKSFQPADTDPDYGSWYEGAVEDSKTHLPGDVAGDSAGRMESGSRPVPSRFGVAWRDMGPIGNADITRELTAGNYSGAVESFSRGELARLPYVLVQGGVDPKQDASSTGSACWRQRDDTLFWQINDGEYLPAYTNVYYHSVQRGPEGEVVDTHEFGFAIACGCPNTLQEGDTVVIQIGATGWPAMYQLSSTLGLPVIAAQPLYLTGGQDGDDIATLTVEGSETGPMPAYFYDPHSPWPYAENGLSFTYTPGAISAAEGDKWTFQIEGGHYRWRRDEEPWLGPLALDAGDTPLERGMSLRVEFGAAPSFAIGDAWAWRVLQPHAPARIVYPNEQGWRWQTAAAELVATLPTSLLIEAVLIAWQDLPDGATVTIAHSADGVAWTPIVMPVRDNLSLAILPAPVTASHLRLTVSGAEGGRIGWWWAGRPWAPSRSASTYRPRRSYAGNRSDGLNPTGLFAGQGVGAEISWEPGSAVGGHLAQADIQALTELLDHVYRQGRQRFVVVPHVAHPDEASVVWADGDAVEIQDYQEYQPNEAAGRLLGVRLTLQPEYFLGGGQ